MAITLTELKQWRAETAIPGGTRYECYFPIGSGLTLADAGIVKGATLPDDADAGVYAANRTKRDGMAVARIIAHKPDYADAEAPNRTGTVTGAGTTVTATTPIFYPSMAGDTVTITDVGERTVASVTSQTVIVTTADATGADKAISFTTGSRELDQSDEQRWVHKGYWSAIKRFHCAAGDREYEKTYHARTTYTFTADAGAPAGEPHSMRSLGKDPMFPHKELVEIEFRTRYDPFKYPVDRATIQMVTGKAYKRLTEALSGTFTEIETQPDANGYYHRPVIKGSNEVPADDTYYIVRTAYAAGSIDYEWLSSCRGRFNKNAWPKLANIAPKEALCVDVKSAPTVVQDRDTANVPVEFVFRHRPGWSWEDIEVIRRRRWPKGRAVLHPDDDPTKADDRYYLQKDGTKSAKNDDSKAEIRVAMVDEQMVLATGDGGTRVVTLERDFSALKTMWSWLP